MSARFRLPSFAFFAAALFLCETGPAQSATTNAPAAIAPAPAAAAMTPVPSGANAALTSPVEASKSEVASAIKLMNANNVEGAMSSLNQAIKLNPNNAFAYVLRASIYSQKHLWQQAESDFNSAAKIAPKNTVVQMQLVELKFMQKQYDAARPGFSAFTKDPEMGDYAAYKVFLCDLFGGHDDVARKELDVFNDTMGNPSYYFSNAAWDLYHKKPEDARDWLVSASHIYPVAKFTMYGQPLRDLGYLPIPEPKNPDTFQ